MDLDLDLDLKVELDLDLDLNIAGFARYWPGGPLIMFSNGG